MSRAEPEIRVLLVDDEAGFRQPVAKRLARRGLAVDQAGSGQEALALLEKRPADVVVLDVKMPGMDGLTALAKIKEGHPKTEVILLTGQASPQDGVAGIKGGAFDYLTKPVELEHLTGKIRQAFEKIRRIEERTREEEFRARMEQQMIATERLASLGTLATGIAHEINNPLAIISESAGWLKSRVAKDETLSGPLRDNFNMALDKVESSVNRAKRITHQLLDFARKTDSIVREFDLEELAAEVIELTKKGAKAAGAGIEIKVETQKTTLW
ncbi:MAG: response regulator, partial [Deltaproteobacteria bacterium]|nr:response regulator [Deltaproteobacteria bacterium]